MLMLSSRNLLNPANGKPIVYPTQDMVLGIYFLTKVDNTSSSDKKYYDNLDEIFLAVEMKKAHYNQKMKYKFRGKWIETTFGRVIFNEIIPEKMDYINDTLTSKKIESLIAACYKMYGIKETAKLVDDLKTLGFKYSTIYGVTISVSDVEIPRKSTLLSKRLRKKSKRPRITREKALSPMMRNTTRL